ncbi:MAG TPA: MFS transporter [Burkholderiales bacterium]|nr:MFS transporter [Burkholderiales bacterium]
MRNNWRTPAMVLICGGVILALSLGIRHSFGLFLAPMSMEFGWGRETFAFAIALQNLIWGAAQPFSGAIADRYGSGRVLVGGALLYVAGLMLMALSHSGLQLSASAGILIGLGLSGTSFTIVYGVIGRTFAPEKRSMALGIAGAAGSFGQFIMLPYGQTLISNFGWLASLLVLAATAVLMAPLASALAEKREPEHTGVPQQSISAALHEAATHKGFWLLCFGFFVCGFQVVFIGVHLPAFLIDQKFSPFVGTMALALIGLFNIVGTYMFGYLGGRYTKKYLLSGIYFLRGVAITIFISLPLTSASVYIFAAVIGILWLGTVPLTNGIVAQIFGVRYVSTLFGVVFLCHQIGSFLGVWLGGYLYDVTGSYRLVWLISIGLGVVAALANWPIDERQVERLRVKESAA